MSGNYVDPFLADLFSNPVGVEHMIMSSSQPRVILITGASSGIGRACSIALSQAFSPLVLILSGRREAELHATAKECREGTVTEICVGDVSDEKDVEKMFGVIKEKYAWMWCST